MSRPGTFVPATAVAMALALTGCSSDRAETSCHSDVSLGTLPEWAMTGFSDGAEVPHAIGHDERILAVPFSQPLVASSSSEPQNKVLFVSREPLAGPTPLTIEARLDGTGDAVTRLRPDGPGPGTLDLPSPGCWRLSLSWTDQTDTLDLEYVSSTS